MMLNSISLLDEPGYAPFFLLLANRCIDLFERTMELPHLELGIELLERFSAVQEPGTIVHLMAAMEYACACLQYSLTANIGEALDDARRIVNEASRASSASPWISVFGDMRTKVILADLIRNRNEMFVPEEDFIPIVHASLQLLNNLSPSPDLYTSLQVLVISVVLFLSQSADSEEFLGSLDALDCILRGQSDLSSMYETLLLISNAISHCSINRTICLIFMADVLDSEVADPPRPLKDTKVQVAWENEWESAQMFLQHRITGSQQGHHGIDAFSTPIFLKFKIHGEVLYRSSLLNIKVDEEGPPGTHICVFNLRMVPASDCEEVSHESKISEGLTHYDFFEHLQGLCNTLFPDDLKYFSDHPSELDRLFKRSKRLENTPYDEPIAVWKKSPGVIAYLLTQTGKSLADRKRAAQQMLKVDLEHEPGYTQLLHRLVGYLRNCETDDEAVGISSTLIKQFLGAQKRGTSMHFTGTVELATNYLMEFLSQPRRTALLALSVELFREAVESRGDESWFVEARKVVTLGHILHNRLKCSADSEELLTQTIDHFITLWDTLPIGRPFSVSSLEMIAVNALLYLSQNLEFEVWIDALKLLQAGLNLYINGLESESLDTVKNTTSTLELVLDGGVNVGSSGLASKTLCLFHVSDMWRSIALDICRNPGYLELSAEMYRRSLRLQLGDTLPNEDNLRSCRHMDKDGLIQALTFLTQTNSVGTSASIFGEVPLSIFRYQATRPTKKNEPTSYSHNCVLRYHPTKVSYLPQVFEESAPSSPTPDSECSSTPGMPQIPAWPNDLMALPPSSQSSLKTHPVTHSAIFPGIEKVLYNEGDEIFKMPLEPRTIKALMRSIEENVHTNESDFSYLSERVVHQSSQVVYMDPREVQLSTRIAKLKLGSSPYFARFAPLQALLSRGPERCLELIESSRTLFWTRLLRLQATFDGLPEDLARELEDTAHKLDSCKSQSVASVSKEDMRWQFELESNFEHLLCKAREIPGFENLLRPKGYEDLLQASVGGPVIVLMGTNSTYAALVITAKGVNSVFLPGLTSISLEKLTRGFNQANSLARSSVQQQVDDGEPEEGRGTRPNGMSMPFYESFLRGLWNLVVKPIFEFMGLLSSVSPPENPRPRLWWCPTGDFTFLPLHAAGFGFGTKNMESVSKYAVSSYTPTLSALISARSKISRTQVSDLRSLVLCQPTTKGYANLPNTAKELALVESLTPASQLLRIGSGPLISSNANKTVDEAVAYLKQASILHLACHGHQDRADPLNSGFELNDGRLTVANLISCHPPKAFLAILSACESAANDHEVPDESLNLSAAMLYAGFLSVIGTLWSMNDNDGPLIARSIYEEVFKDPTASLDPEMIAYALDSAIQKLEQNGVHPSRWATYIHVGI